MSWLQLSQHVTVVTLLLIVFATPRLQAAEQTFDQMQTDLLQWKTGFAEHVVFGRGEAGVLLELGFGGFSLETSLASTHLIQ